MSAQPPRGHKRKAGSEDRDAGSSGNSTVNCIICGEDVSVQDIMTHGCGGQACRDCWHAWLAEQVRSSDGSEANRPACVARCEEGLSDVDIENLAAPDIALRWTQRHFAHTQTDFYNCPMGDCNYGFFWVRDQDPRVIRCVGCERRICMVCYEADHGAELCDRRQRRIAEEQRNSSATQATNKWLEENTKLCPSCGQPLDKSKEGCDHMTCHCGHQFCFVCLEEYTNIHRSGNHLHKPWCKYRAGTAKNPDMTVMMPPLPNGLVPGGARWQLPRRRMDLGASPAERAPMHRPPVEVQEAQGLRRRMGIVGRNLANELADLRNGLHRNVDRVGLDRRDVVDLTRTGSEEPDVRRLGNNRQPRRRRPVGQAAELIDLTGDDEALDATNASPPQPSPITAAVQRRASLADSPLAQRPLPAAPRPVPRGRPPRPAPAPAPARPPPPAEAAAAGSRPVNAQAAPATPATRPLAAMARAEVITLGDSEEEEEEDTDSDDEEARDDIAFWAGYGVPAGGQNLFEDT